MQQNGPISLELNFDHSNDDTYVGKVSNQNQFAKGSHFYQSSAEKVSRNLKSS